MINITSQYHLSPFKIIRITVDYDCEDWKNRCHEMESTKYQNCSYTTNIESLFAALV